MSDVVKSSAAIKKAAWLESSGLDLRALLGATAYKELEHRACLPALHACFSRSSLTPGEQANLFSLPLPLLLKSVEVYRSLSAPEAPLRLRPLQNLSLVSLMEKYGPVGGVDTAIEDLRKNVARLASGVVLSVVLDRWRGVNKLGATLEALAAIRDAEALQGRIEILGPSTADVIDAIPRYSALVKQDAVLAIRGTLQQLQTAGFNSIEGGGDLEIHEFAQQQGFTLSLAHLLMHNSAASASPRIRMNNLVSQLSKVRSALHDSGQLQTWFPWTPTLLRRSAEGPTLAEFLRMLAIGRLLLPKTTYIKSPLAIIGAPFGEVAQAFGANDFGFIAVDQATAKECGLPLVGEISPKLLRGAEENDGN